MDLASRKYFSRLEELCLFNSKGKESVEKRKVKDTGELEYHPGLGFCHGFLGK